MTEARYSLFEGQVLVNYSKCTQIRHACCFGILLASIASVLTAQLNGFLTSAPFFNEGIAQSNDYLTAPVG